ncbi:unnamed protein product [Plasmodium vivax]|uniref:(malaria parasite P. vivax) hypothetical protein n=1 Tax=Plasmodium vivax TaxID=5855 RepID=A0A8S4H683_PLAVI|nr:unnamed protein product [Plasmodium vivax]
MSDIIDDNEQITRKFYLELDADVDPSKLNDLKAYSAYKNVFGDEENIKILDKLARNIKLIKHEYHENHKKRCRDVNYWFNDQIKTYQARKRASILSDAATVYNGIKWNGRNDERVCVINENPYSSKDADLMKELDDYCEIRDINKCNVSKDYNECLKCNKYIEKKKQDITSKMQVVKDYLEMKNYRNLYLL